MECRWLGKDFQYLQGTYDVRDLSPEEAVVTRARQAGRGTGETMAEKAYNEHVVDSKKLTVHEAGEGNVDNAVFETIYVRRT